MNCTYLNLRFILLLVGCSLIWNTCNCAVIRSVKTSSSGNGEADWREENFPELPKDDVIKPLPWDKSVTFSIKNDIDDWWRKESPKTLPWDDDKSFRAKIQSELLNNEPWDLEERATLLQEKNMDEWWKKVIPTAFPWDEDKEWWKKIRTVPTLRPFDWEWNRFTIKPFEWNRITLPPSTYNKRSTLDDTALKIAIFVPLTIVFVIAMVCKYFVCNNRDSNLDGSARVLHLPPRRTEPPPRRTAPPPQTRTVYSLQNTTQPTVHSSSLASTTPSRNSHGVTDTDPNRSNINDKPPAYSQVVISDLAGDATNFPEVKPSCPESPPPYYDEKNVMRY